LRLIAAHDVTPAVPMVLCVSNIFWVDSEDETDGFERLSRAEFEMTDGWYRLRAKVDAPLTRAARKGKIKVGCKIGIIGAGVRVAHFVIRSIP